MKNSERNVFETFRFGVLSEQEMNVVVGGKRRKPKSRDKDIFDEGDE